MKGVWRLKVAIFDFDGTLFPEETFTLMMKHLKEHPTYNKKYRAFMLKIIPAYAAYKMKIYPENKMKEFSMRSYISSFKEFPEPEIELFFSELGNTMIGHLNEVVVKRLEEHHEQGYYIMLVSGAFLPLLESVSKNLSVNCMIGTTIPFKNSFLDNDTPIYHINGHRKTDKIFSHLANEEIDWKNSYAYGDSFSDLNVLELVGNPVAVKPEAKLLAVATKRNWEVL